MEKLTLKISTLKRLSPVPLHSVKNTLKVLREQCCMSDADSSELAKGNQDINSILKYILEYLGMSMVLFSDCIRRQGRLIFHLSIWSCLEWAHTFVPFHSSMCKKCTSNLVYIYIYTSMKTGGKTFTFVYVYTYTGFQMNVFCNNHK